MCSNINMEKTANMDSNPVSFFGFPRELRDLVYSNLYRKINASPKDIKERIKYRVYVEHGPVSEALLVSRQFKEEYEEEIWRHSSISINAERAQDLDACAVVAKQLPGCAEKIRHLRVCVYASNLESEDYEEDEAFLDTPQDRERYIGKFFSGEVGAGQR